MVLFRNEVAVVLMSSQHLQLPAVGLHKAGPINISNRLERELRAQPLPRELLSLIASEEGVIGFASM